MHTHKHTHRRRYSHCCGHRIFPGRKRLQSAHFHKSGLRRAFLTSCCFNPAFLCSHWCALFICLINLHTSALGGHGSFGKKRSTGKLDSIKRTLKEAKHDRRNGMKGRFHRSPKPCTIETGCSSYALCRVRGTVGTVRPCEDVGHRQWQCLA